MKPVDRALVERLLEDPNLSFREIARQADCSDWSVRSVARDMGGTARPMKWAARRDDDEKTDASGWIGLVVVVAVFFGIFWLAARRAPPDGPMP